MHNDVTPYLIGLHLFSRVLQASPDEELLRKSREDGLFRAFASWPCFRFPESSPFTREETEKALSELARAYSPEDAAPPDYRALYLELHQDHLALFSGPGPAAPPWESVWREKDKLLFGEQTDKVREFYKLWGIGTDKEGREPEDHLGLELAFAAFLLQAAQGGIEAAESGGDPDESAVSFLQAEEALSCFLEQHILPWSGACLKKASECAASPFYRHIPVLCETLLLNLRGELTAR